jgi:hypothetical protein
MQPNSRDCDTRSGTCRRRFCSVFSFSLKVCSFLFLWQAAILSDGLEIEIHYQSPLFSFFMQEADICPWNENIGRLATIARIPLSFLRRRSTHALHFKDDEK